jgi:TP901 family phage tail tape measure protein
MTTSAGNTDNLSMSVDNLGRKINNLAKTAGKTLIGISAADVATITGATAAWSSYEKQVSRLQAQSAILTRTNAQQTLVMKDYTAAVKGLRTEYGTTTSEASKLVETLSKVTSMRQTRDLQDLSKVFVDMSHATGESSDGLASSLTNLQRVMGTPINSKNTRQYADQFTYLAAQTNTSAQGLIDFTSQLAPAGRQIGITSNQMAGFATAFAKAGQDSGPAATVFTKITTDIAHSMQTGSPEIAHYANMLGVTQKAFKAMSGGEQVVAILQNLQDRGKGAATELSRLGLDGPRSIRAIQAVLQQGGLAESMQLATSGGSKGAAAEGAAASTKGLSDEVNRLTQNFQQLAETMGGYFGPVMEKFLQGMNKALEVVNKIAEGPMGKFVALVMTVVAPLASGAGMLLLFAGALMKVATAFAAFRSSAAYGIREGFAGGGPLGSGAAGLRGQQLEQAGTWFQRAQYRGGQTAGSLASSALGAARGGWQTARGWADPNYTPGPPRSALSYMAGGLGRGIDMFLTPTFDQMRYADPTKRERSRFWQRTQMGQSAAVSDAAATADAARERARTAGAVYQSMLGSQGASADQTEQARRDMHRANQEALSTTRASVAAQKDQIATVQRLNQETGNTTTGFRRLAQSAGGFAAGAGGGVLGAGRAGLSALARSPIAGNIAFGLGGAALGAAGVQSQALMFGAMGGMMGGAPGAVAGGVIGAALDARQRTQNFNQIVAARQQALREGLPSGILSANQAATSEFQPYQQYQQESIWGRLTHPGSIVGNVGRGLGSAWQFASGGGDAYKTRQDQADAAKTQSTALIGALTDVSRRQGVSLKGIDPTTQSGMAKLDEVTNKLAPTMEKLGITTDDIVKAYQGRGTSGGAQTWKTMMGNLVSPDQALGYISAAGGTAAGAAMADSASARRSIRLQEDVGAFYNATSDIFSKLHKQGLTDQQIMASTEKAQARIGDENSRSYELQMAVSQKAQQNIQMQMPLMTRAQQFQATIGQMNALSGITPRTQEQAAQLEQQKTATAQGFVDQASYFKQLLLMQDQYEIQRTRAQQDYSLQRSYQEHDYQLQRSRQEYQFHLSQNRATADYYRSVRRAQYDFNLQRSRSEADYQHSVSVQAKQMAQSVYDIYSRVQVQRTSSASQILSNAADQLQRMRQQESDLQRLRAMGASDSMIQQMKFTDPQNQQQLARFLTEATPRVIRQFNQVAGSLREGAAKALATDPSSLDWQEQQRSHRLQMQRSRQDFQRQLELGHEDFARSLSRQRKDFNLMMDQQATDFSTQMGRQADAYQLSMQRSAQDLANVGKEIDGNFESTLVQATKRLSGHAQAQAAAVLKSFTTLKSSTSAQAVATMKDLASIFGFKYQAPAGINTTPVSTPRGTQDMSLHGTGGHVVGGNAEGGIVPGWSPGRDDKMVPLSGGEAIMRPEWARAMGGAAIDAMNHAAKHGGLAAGGIYRPIKEPVSRGLHDQFTGYSAVDFAAPVGMPVYAVAGGRISRSYDIPGPLPSDSYHDPKYGPYGSYGRVMYLKTDMGPEVLYAHLSKRGFGQGAMVSAGQPIGLSGSAGNSSGPHLHFGDNDGNPYEFITGAGRGAGTINGFVGGQVASTRAQLRKVFKRLYPDAERAAWDMQGVHPLNPGDISSVINQMGRDVVRRIRQDSTDTAGVGATNLGRAPSGNLSNEAIVHTAANRMGWGKEWSALRQIVMHESGFNNTAQNPNSTAYGMFQFLDSTWGNYGGHKTSDPWLQAKYGMNYIRDRYNDPNGAWNFWQSHNWYGDGSVFTSPNMIGVGEKGPEAVIPLNDRGGEFLTKAMMGVDARRIGMSSTPVGGGLHVFNTRIDKSTNFTGPITVQANDPNELLNKLQARQRVMALSRPSLTGSAA